MVLEIPEETRKVKPILHTMSEVRRANRFAFFVLWEATSAFRGPTPVPSVTPWLTSLFRKATLLLAVRTIVRMKRNSHYSP